VTVTTCQHLVGLSLAGFPVPTTPNSCRDSFASMVGTARSRSPLSISSWSCKFNCGVRAAGTRRSCCSSSPRWRWPQRPRITARAVRSAGAIRSMTRTYERPRSHGGSAEPARQCHERTGSRMPSLAPDLHRTAVGDHQHGVRPNVELVRPEPSIYCAQHGSERLQ
jgi:hypothetical protein